MASITPICGIRCDFCTKFLSPPTVYLQKCRHLFHAKCFAKIAKERACSQCDFKISKAVKDPELDSLIFKLNRISKAVLDNSNPKVSKKAILLHEAIEEELFEYVRDLLNRGVSPNVFVDDISPLYRACLYDQLKIAALLLQRRASATNKNGGTFGEPINTDNYKYSEHYEATPLECAVKRGQSRALVELLIAHRADPCQKTNKGLPLLYEASGRDPRILEYLLQTKAKEGINNRIHNFYTPLHRAVKEGAYENVKLLVQSGADISLIYEGNTILEIAEKTLAKRVEDEYEASNQKAIVEFLKSKMKTGSESKQSKEITESSQTSQSSSSTPSSSLSNTSSPVDQNNVITAEDFETSIWDFLGLSVELIKKKQTVDSDKPSDLSAPKSSHNKSPSLTSSISSSLSSLSKSDFT